MRLDGRRTSSNVEDRRGSSGKVAGGIGIGGLLIIGLIYLLGGNSSGLLGSLTQSGAIEDILGGITSNGQSYTPTAEEEELAKFSMQILAGTEDIWSELFKKMGKQYTPPTLVLFTNSVTSGCGNATSAVGPFYCSADQKLYIDLSFFSSMKQQLGASGDFAYAYVIAHEVGHHVENLLGELEQVHKKMAQSDKVTANKWSVRLELRADFLAGIWGHYDNKLFQSLEVGDVEEAIRCSEVIGDDYLQKKAQGRTVPDSFTHGTSKQRTKWLTLGLKTGDLSQGNTYACSDSEL